MEPPKLPENFESKTLSEKLQYGLLLSYQKLVAEAKKNDETLVFGRDGKPVHVRARDLED